MQNGWRVMRTLKSDLEDRMKRRVPVEHPAFSWLAEHAAWLLTTRQKLDNGSSPHQEAKGSRFSRDLLCFGEMCLCKVTLGKLARDLEGKTALRWRSGVL